MLFRFEDERLACRCDARRAAEHSLILGDADRNEPGPQAALGSRR